MRISRAIPVATRRPVFLRSRGPLQPGLPRPFFAAAVGRPCFRANAPRPELLSYNRLNLKRLHELNSAPLREPFRVERQGCALTVLLVTSLALIGTCSSASFRGTISDCLRPRTSHPPEFCRPACGASHQEPAARQRFLLPRDPSVTLS